MDIKIVTYYRPLFTIANKKKISQSRTREKEKNKIINICNLNSLQ